MALKNIILIMCFIIHEDFSPWKVTLDIRQEHCRHGKYMSKVLRVPRAALGWEAASNNSMTVDTCVCSVASVSYVAGQWEAGSILVDIAWCDRTSGLFSRRNHCRFWFNSRLLSLAKVTLSISWARGGRPHRRILHPFEQWEPKLESGGRSKIKETNGAASLEEVTARHSGHPTYH